METDKFFKLSKDEEQKALDLHHKAIVIDMCNLSSSPPNDKYFDILLKAGITSCHNKTTRYAERYTDLPDASYLHFALRNISEWLEVFESYPNKALLAINAEDIEKAKKENKIAVIGSGEGQCGNSYVIGHDLSLLKIFKKLGVKIWMPTYQDRSFIGDGCGEMQRKGKWVDEGCGVSKFGEQWVAEMNRLHLLIDLSHAGWATTNDILELSKDPVAFTHANPAGAKIPHVRDKSDEQIKALAEKSGVMGIHAFTPAGIVKEGVWPTIEDYISFIDYVVNLVGVDHVGIGLDIGVSFPEKTDIGRIQLMLRSKYTELWKKVEPDVQAVLSEHSLYPKLYPELISSLPGRFKGLENYEGVPNITRGLVAHGYSDQEIEKILGLNWLSLLKKVWGK
ncbi:MAG: membrane dipeptidase [Candidatus Bathyarchaeota archaeon]|nr:MAG: membrane dipeptidase [Candidatus Bathyarchaeota archaeon]